MVELSSKLGANSNSMILESTASTSSLNEQDLAPGADDDEQVGNFVRYFLLGTSRKPGSSTNL
jgi:hypothetical protein